MAQRDETPAKTPSERLEEIEQRHARLMDELDRLDQRVEEALALFGKRPEQPAA